MLTISPQLMSELKSSTENVERRLSAPQAGGTVGEKITLDEKGFRWRLNEDAMATEKLSEGIRLFNADAVKLKKHLASLLG